MILTPLSEKKIGTSAQRFDDIIIRGHKWPIPGHISSITAKERTN